MISVLYLAEVQKKTRMIGNSKAELKLLARQDKDIWNAVAGEEIIPAPDELSNYNTGVLLMVDLSASKQLQRHTEASRQIVTILQNFSRVQEKSKTQSEEIDQWRDSLTYQSQMLNEREVELETRMEELQQKEAELQGLEGQRQAVDTARQEVERLREEFDRKSQELEGAWAQLQGEKNRLDERQAELQGAVGLDAAQATYLQDLLNRISGTVTPVDTIQEQLNGVFAVIYQQQGKLDGYWQQLDQQRASAQQLQEESDRQTQAVQNQWQAWQQAQAEFEQAKAALHSQQALLNLRQSYAQSLTVQIQYQDGLYQQVAQLAGASDKVNLEALEQMPIEELQSIVADLEQELTKLSRFVSSQEEELTAQQDMLDDLQKQMETASEYDRLRLEADFKDEQDGYQMLNQTLIGQRRNLQDRQEVLKQHRTILAKRQGNPLDSEDAIDFRPVLGQIEQARARLLGQLHDLEQEIEQLQGAIAQSQARLEQQASSQAAAQQGATQGEQQLWGQLKSVGELWGKVNAYQEALQPLQDDVHSLRERAEAIASMMTQFQEANHYQMQSIGEMQQSIEQLVGQHSREYAAA